MPFDIDSSFSSMDCPPEVSEWDLTGLTPVPSDTVKPPRVGESAFSMECTMDMAHDVSRHLALFVSRSVLQS